MSTQTWQPMRVRSASLRAMIPAIPVACVVLTWAVASDELLGGTAFVLVIGLILGLRAAAWRYSLGSHVLIVDNEFIASGRRSDSQKVLTSHIQSLEWSPGDAWPEWTRLYSPGQMTAHLADGEIVQLPPLLTTMRSDRDQATHFVRARARELGIELTVWPRPGTGGR